MENHMNRWKNAPGNHFGLTLLIMITHANVAKVGKVMTLCYALLILEHMECCSEKVLGYCVVGRLLFQEPWWASRSLLSQIPLPSPGAAGRILPAKPS